MGTRKILEELRNQRADFQALSAQVDDSLRFNNELLRRHEIAFVDMTNALAELRAESRENARATRENAKVTRESAQMVRDCAEVTRAHTRAIMALLDRFDDGAAPAT